MLTFLHLSDIHFKRQVAPKRYDVDSDLRNEVQRDIVRQMEGAATGILVTGDVAFAGLRDEYTQARTWLAELTKQIGCAESDVWTVPGNHDVDRNIVEDSDTIRELHKELRELRGYHLEKRLQQVLGDAVETEGLLRPLSEYNRFALSYGCSITAENISWCDDLELDDGSILRLAGLTSPLISDKHDHIETGRLFLSAFQRVLKREDGVEYLSMCHHPFDWLTDRDDAVDALDRAKLRLFGHKHRQRLREENNGLLLVAGAMHPDRILEQQWQPRFNIIRIKASPNEHGKRLMQIEVEPRVWDDAETAFKPDVDVNGLSKRSFTFELPEWGRPHVTAVSASPISAETIEATNMEGTKCVERPERTLTYRFLSLPPQRQQRVSLEQQLIGEEEWFSSESELWRAVFARARDRGALPSLWNAVEAAIGDGRFSGYANPFEKGA